MCRKKQGVFFVNSWDFRLSDQCFVSLETFYQILKKKMLSSNLWGTWKSLPTTQYGGRKRSLRCITQTVQKKSRRWINAPRHHHLQPILASMMENADMVVYIAVNSGTSLPKPLQHQLINLSRKHLLDSQGLYPITLLSAIMIGHNNVMGYWCLHCSTTIYTVLVLNSYW